MPTYSEQEQDTIRALFRRYKLAREYGYGEIRKRLKANGVRCNRSHLSRLYNFDQPFPGLSGELARGLHVVLRFGQTGPTLLEASLEPKDFDEWVKATHLDDFREQLQADFVEHQLLELFRFLLRLVKVPPRAALFIWDWIGARVMQLRMRHQASIPLSEAAIHLAIQADAPRELVGIMYYDLAGAYQAVGDFTASIRHGEASRNQYLHLARQGGTAPNISVGIGRASVRQLTAAVWTGEPIERCLELVDEARRFLEPQPKPEYPRLRLIEDHYGLAEVYHMLGYLYLLEDNLEQAEAMAKIARGHVARIGSFEGDIYWSMRDGSFIGSRWCRLHVLALEIDVALLRLPPLDVGGSTGNHAHLTRLLLEREDLLLAAFWVRHVPPLFSYFGWKLDYILGWKTADQLEQQWGENIAAMRDLPLRHALPLTMVAYGDFFQEVRHLPVEAARWYEEAATFAQQIGILRHVKYAQDRLDHLWTRES